MQSEMGQKDLVVNSPAWIANAIVYQIFPDRFRRSGRVEAQNHLVFKGWGSDPIEQGFHGGDLYGVLDSLDYLERLGINCIYLTPVFSSASNHRYHTYDYFHVDPLLGGNQALDALIDGLHSRGMRIVLDGVFNHCGRGFWAFHHLLENGEDSPYKDWFCIEKWPLCPYPKRGQSSGYSCWWNNPALPKFNYQHPPVRDYFLSVGLYWIERGIDGWRLDVPNEVPQDFWVEFRQKVKRKNPEVWIIGEIWGDARSWLDGNHFDGVMNYRIGWSSLCWAADKSLNKNYVNPFYPLRKLKSEQFIDILRITLGWYSTEVNRSQLNLLDSHDVPRALNTLMGDISALKIALLFLFLQPGAPCIYYGTEAALSGGIEPSCRESFPWGKDFDKGLTLFIRSLVDLRKQLFSCYGDTFEWDTFGEDGIVGKMNLDLESPSKKDYSVVALINRSRKSWLPIIDYSTDPFFLIGQIDLSQDKRLGPQSAAVILLSTPS